MWLRSLQLSYLDCKFVLLAPKLAGGYKTFLPRNVKWQKIGEKTCSAAPAGNEIVYSLPQQCPKARPVVLRLSVPSVSCAGGGRGWSFSENSVRKLYSAWDACVHTDRICRIVSCFDVVESSCVGSPAGENVSCAAVADGGVCHFWNMTVPHAGTGNSESTGTAHVKGPVSMASVWYLCLQ
jgi:hypothetical protein